MKKLKLNRYALILVIVPLLLLGAGTPSALAASSCDNIWQEGPSINYYYLDANYADYQDTALLVIEIDGDATDFQTFNVGDTVTITSHLRAVAVSCSGGHNESFSIATLEATGPSGTSSDTTGNIFHFSDTECSVTDHEETLSISYALSSLGMHTVSMNSNAQIGQYWGAVAVEKICTANLSFVVVVPFTSLGDCVSTLIDAECDGLKGQDRAMCAKDEIGYCHGLFAACLSG